MPANLPPEYFEAEKRFKEASTPAEKVAALEALIATVPKHKGTDKLRAALRRRLSRLREEIQHTLRTKKSSRFNLYIVEREGAAQLALIGLANAGKSSLLGLLTHARPLVADYPMSTLSPVTGMMPFEDIQIQLIDLPPLGNVSTDGWVSGLIRQSDALLLVLDLSEDPLTSVDLIIDTLKSWNIIPIGAEGKDTDLLHGTYKRSLLIGNKLDAQGAIDGLNAIVKRFSGIYPIIGVSSKRKGDTEKLRRAIFNLSDVIRVYTKEPGGKPDLSMPFTMKKGATVLDLCREIHKDFLFNFRFARVWGSARFDGQKVQKDYKLQDRDIVEIHV